MPDVLEQVRKRRGPFTRIVIGLVVAWMLLGIGRMVLAYRGGADALTALGQHAEDLVSVPVLLVLLLFVIADVWVKPRLDNAYSLALTATWVSSFAVVLAIGAGVAGLWSPGLKPGDRALEVANIVVSVVVPVLLCVALGTVAGAAKRAGQQSAIEGSGQAAIATTEDQGPAPASEEPTTGDSRVGPSAPEAPTWTPDESAGAAWSTAADAAKGGPAAAWGDTTTPFGWEPPANGSGTGESRGAAADGKRPHEHTAPEQLDRGLWEKSPKNE